MTSPEKNTDKVSTANNKDQELGDGKYLQPKLERERDKIQLIINSINVIFWEANAQTFQFDYVSHQAESISGYPVSDWLDEKDFWAKHIHPEDRDEVMSYCQNSISKLEDHSFEYRMITKDGREVWLHDKVSVISEDGKAMVLRGVMIDITENKLAELKLVESQMLNQLIIENSGEGIILSDPKGNVYAANPKACQVFGRTEEEILKIGLDHLIDTADPRFGNLIRKREEDGFFRGELIGIRKEGSKVDLDVSSQIFKGINGESRISLILSDITEIINQKDIKKSRIKVLKLLTTGAPLASVLKTIALEIEANNDEMLCSILLMDKVGKHLVLGSAPSFPKFYQEAVNGIEIGPAVGSCGSAAYLGEVVIIDDIQIHPNWKDKTIASRAGLNSCWSQPIKDSSDKVIGVFAIYHQAIKVPSPADFNLIKEYAGLAAIAIEESNVLAAIKERSERHEKFYNSTPIMMYSIDVKGRLISVSDYWLKKMEYRREEVIGKLSVSFHTADSREYAKNETIPKLFKSGIINNVELQFVTKSGKILDTLLSGAIEKNDEGNVHQALAVITDISERRTVEEKVRKNDIRFHAMIENDESLITLYDQNYKSIYRSPSVCKILGWTDEELAQAGPLGLMHPDDLESAKLRMKDVLRNPGKPISSLFKLMHKNGKYIYVEGTVTNMLDNVNAIVSNYRDVTKSKIAEHKLAESELKFRSAINNMADGILVEDADRKTNIVNDRFIDLFNIPIDKEQLIGTDCKESMEQHKVLYTNSDKFIERINELIQNRELILRDKLHLKDGRVLERDYIPVEDDQGSHMWVYRDITESRELESSVRKSAEQLSYASKLAKIGEWELDLISMTLKWSDQVCHIHGAEPGYTPSLEDAINFYTEEYKPIISRAVEQCIETGEYYDLTLQIITLSGQVKWVRAIGVSERAQNKTVKVYGIFQDIDDVKTKEIELGKLALIAKNTDNLVVVTDAKRKIQWVNQAFITTTGYELDEIKGKYPASLLQGPETDMSVLATVREKLNRNESVNFEIVNYSKSGKKYWSDIGIQPVFDDGGELDYFIAIESDITERKLKDKLIKKSESNLRSIFENADTAFILMDNKFEIQSFNSLAKIFTEDVLHSKLEEGAHGLYLFPENRRESISKCFNDALKGKPSHHEINYGKGIEEERWFKGRFFPVNVDNNTSGVIMAVTDSTREKLGEQLLSNNYKELLIINREKETLLKEIHHRVKNNLQLISSIIYIRMTGMQNSETKTFLNETRQKIKSISLIHETLLQQTESTKEVNIDNYLSKLLLEMQVTYASDQSAVIVNLEIDPIMVSIDVAINCSMIVTELFTNSIKHAYKNVSECKISVSLHKKSERIELVMSDNGSGIPDNIRPGEHDSFGMKLLDVFFKQLNAKVSIEGNKGTTYTICFKK